VEQTEGPFFRAGADGVLLAEFRALGESGRYPAMPVLQWLAKVIIGRAVGPNRDTPLFELCHLVAAIDGFGGGADGRWTFFLGIDPPLPRNIRRRVGELAAARSRLPAGLTLSETGLRLARPGAASFEIRYGRMPFLMALYEFLLGMEGFRHAEKIGALFDDLSAAGADAEALRQATNGLAALLRAYRRDHLAWARNDDKFDPLQRFLLERRQENDIVVDDAAILDFWLLHCEGSEFRGYKTVFDTFVRYLRALAEGLRAESAEAALPIGSDFEQGEVDPADEGLALEGLAPWHSPLEIFDSETLAAINCFKAASERKPIEPLMQYGPEALRLPRAFLRLESFAPIQAGITNDLQVKRPAASVQRRIDCNEAETYQARREVYGRLLAHVEQLQKACLHALTANQPVLALAGVAEDHPSADLDKALKEARRAFANLSRRGFEPLEGADDPRIEGFRLAAGALVSMAGLLSRMGANLDRAADLPVWFEEDRRAFSDCFARIYAKVHGGAR
jgi:hypothetical protein